MGIEQKNLILITDGGDKFELDKLAGIIKGKTKTFSIVAVGKRDGSTIIKDDDSLLKNSEGDLVISRINPQLKMLAGLLDGNYIEVTNSVSKDVDSLEKKLKKSDEIFFKKEHKYIELYQIPLFFAMVLFFMLHTKWVKYLLIVLVATNLHAKPTLQSEITKANNHYKHKEYEQALKIYISIKVHHLR